MCVVLTADRGLCGGFNSNICKLAKTNFKKILGEGKNLKIITVGTKGLDQIKREYGKYVIKKFSFKDKKQISFAEAKIIGDEILKLFKQNEFDKCILFFNNFKNVITQIPQSQQIIPAETDVKDIKSDNSISYEFEPEEDEILEDLLPKNVRVLDVGCGGGILAQALGELGAEVTGIDASEKTIGVAKSHSELIKSDVKFFQQTIEEFVSSNPEAKFDVITCLEMLEHVPSPGDIINSCSKILNDNGDIFFSTINRNPKSYLFAVIGAEYVLNLLPKGTHEYEKFIKPSELAKWIRDAGLTTQETIGLSYNPLTDNYWLGKDIQVNYMVHAKRESI